MNKQQKYDQSEQCSVCCMWVDFNAGPDQSACPACLFRDDFIAQAAARRLMTTDHTNARQPPGQFRPFAAGIDDPKAR